ncbi:YobI family P-loop NTPase [Methylophilus aquaticus]|uniref:YobI-like P-loop NTPase domain-containing protein n=1 Tax=Methylophilus aquaticus TaxID=1971610 RepID=A0ABT9JPD3_9PROT|nr:hypothetical protein [Methylophilus aquaticus]MDP8566435.1 hypothetical protein [Methylophilus aquaticus]
MNFHVLIERIVNKLNVKVKKAFLNNQPDSLVSNLETYNALTPNNKADLSEYKNALLYALTHKDIKNIAITGPYGSGKSSILRSFENEYNGSCGYEFLNISLATFDIGNPKLNDEQRIKLNSDVEKSLLQQIFFKVSTDELEDSHFSRLQIKKYKYIPILKKSFLISYLGFAFFIIVFASSLMFTLKPELEIFKHTNLFNPQYKLLFKIFVAISGIALLQQILNSFPKLGLNKFGAVGAEISFNERKGDSILNKFIDELIYFFGKTKYNIVVFEDLDRFPSRDIFIKLREINTLLNYSDEIRKKNKLIKFIFVLGDDVFQNSEDRIKFFDFIVPVIPVINSFNAEEKLRNAISKAFKEHSVEKAFFEDIALFLDDMRMLLNIANEFVVYKKMLAASSHADDESSSKIQLDDTKLLSLIIYKNKYPDDFKDLNYRKGMVATIFANINQYKDEYMLSLKEEVKRLNEKLSEIDNESVNSLEELKLTYLAGYFQKIPDMRSIYINNEYKSLGELLSDDVFNTLISQSTITYVRTEQRFSNTNSNIPFSEIEKSINPLVSYKQRKQNIIDKAGSGKTELKRKISDLEIQIKRASSLKLNELIKKSSHLSLFDGIAKQDSVDTGLIRFLIVNGYIEEDYDAYMSFFYPGELSTNDKQFLISLANQKPLDFNYPLNNPEKVYQRIQPERFSIRAILNFDLLDYLLIEETNSLALEDFLGQIILSEHEGYEFINDYLGMLGINEGGVTRAENKILINKLAIKEKQYWRDFFENIDKDDATRDKLLSIFLLDVSLKDLPIVNVDKFFSDYLAESKTIFEILAHFDLDRVKEIIKVLSLKFRDITSCKSQSILEIVEEFNAYQLSEKNILKILTYLDDSTDQEINAGYTCILESGRQHLTSYVNNKLEIYVKEVLLLTEHLTESELAIRTLINSELDTELIREVIEKFNFKIADITSIENKELWSDLLERNRLDASWDNVIKYFEYSKEDLDEHLISFTGNLDNSLQLGGKRLNSKASYVQSLSKRIIYCDLFNGHAYKNLIKSVPYWYQDLSDIDVSNEKISYLVIDNKFKVTKENHDFLRNKIPELSYKLIENNYPEYAENPTLIILESQEYRALINSDVLESLEKIALIKSIPEAFYDEDDELTETVSTFVVQKTNEKVVTTHIAEKMLSSPIDFELKVKIFNRYAGDFDRTQIKAIVSKIDIIGGLTQNKRPRIMNNADTLALVIFLSMHHYLSYKEEKGQLKLTPKGKLLD